nr:hypothetical transcript [Hymenolepis microstoma]
MKNFSINYLPSDILKLEVLMIYAAVPAQLIDNYCIKIVIFCDEWKSMDMAIGFRARGGEGWILPGPHWVEALTHTHMFAHLPARLPDCPPLFRVHCRRVLPSPSTAAPLSSRLETCAAPAAAAAANL